MKLRPPDEPAVPLSPEMRAILLHGPSAVGKTLREIPDHDAVRALWNVHGASLLVSKGCPKSPWFLDRDEFVTFVRRELV